VLIILPCLLLLPRGAAARPGQVLKSITHFSAYGFLIKRINQDLAGKLAGNGETKSCGPSRSLRGHPFANQPLSSWQEARSTLNIQNALNEA